MSNGIYYSFCGGISDDSARRISGTISSAVSNGKIGEVHLLFHSSGGEVAAGVFLHNFFRALPGSFTIYNGGTVQSAAATAFLGAANRKTSAHGTFMIHGTTLGWQGKASPAELHAFTTSLEMDDAVTEDLLKQYLSLDAVEWNDRRSHALYFTADRAVRVGFVDAKDGIKELAPPSGSPVIAI